MLGRKGDKIMDELHNEAFFSHIIVKLVEHRREWLCGV
jgi:hypothetical protein